MLIQELVEKLRKAINSKTRNWRVDPATNIPYFIGSDLYENKDDWEEASNHLDKLVKGEVSTPPKLAFDLHDDAVIEALTILTKEDGPTIKIINTWYYLGDKAIGSTKVLWEYYEKLEDYKRNEMLLTIMRIEGKESKAIKILEKKKNKGELTEYELNNFNFHLQELKIEDKIARVEQSAHHSSFEIKSVSKEIEKQLDSEEKKKQENKISELQKINDEQIEIIRDLRSSVKDLSKAHREIIENPRHTVEEYQKISGNKSWWVILVIQCVLIIGNFFIEVYANTVNWKPWYPLGFVLLFGGIFIASILSAKRKI